MKGIMSLQKSFSTLIKFAVLIFPTSVISPQAVAKDLWAHAFLKSEDSVEIRLDFQTEFGRNANCVICSGSWYGKNIWFNISGGGLSPSDIVELEIENYSANRHGREPLGPKSIVRLQWAENEKRFTGVLGENLPILTVAREGTVNYSQLLRVFVSQNSGGSVSCSHQWRSLVDPISKSDLFQLSLIDAAGR